MLKVYLDTNILILGGQRSEHQELKRLAHEKQILLFKSWHGDIEQHGHVFQTRRKRDLLMKDLYKSEEHFSAFKEANDEYERTSQLEQTEKDYWSDVGLHHPGASFDVLVAHSAYSPGLIPDFKGELQLFEDLINNYKIKAKDAFHAMSAHSSGMNYLLTWDRKSFINKCQKIQWLSPKVVTPKVFLSKIL